MMQSTLDEIDKKIGDIIRQLDGIPHELNAALHYISSLGYYYDKRYDLLGKLDDLERVIQFKNLELALSLEGDEHLPNLLYFLASVHGIRYERLGERDDNEAAIAYTRRAFELAPDSEPNRSSMLNNLGASYGRRFRDLGELQDLECMIKYAHMAVDSASDDDPNLTMMLANLGTSHIQLFQRLGDLKDLEKAIELQSLAVSLTPESHPLFTGILSQLGDSHNTRFQRLGELNDLEKAIELNSRAITLTPIGHPRLSLVLFNTGMSHQIRYDRLGEVNDLEKAIEDLSGALSLTPDSYPGLATILNNLAGSHKSRFQRLGKLDDLEKAIEYQHRALSLTPDGHPLMPGILHNLASNYSSRYERLGEINDLENAIEQQSCALVLTPDDHPEVFAMLSSLGVFHLYRFQRFDDLNDLEVSVEFQYRALGSTPEGHPSVSIILGHLAESHRSLFKRLGDPSNLDKAIEYESRALALTPEDHPDLLVKLANLGEYHLHRFADLGLADGLEQSINFQSRALTLMPENHPRYSSLSGDLAQSYFMLYKYTKDQASLQCSLDSFRSASRSLPSPPRLRFRIAQDWAKLTAKYCPENCLEAYQTSIDLLPQFIWLGATTGQRYEDLLMAEKLAINAACAAIHSSDHALALEWLEHGRCVVWNQALMLRSPLDELLLVDPDLGSQLQNVANRLHSAGSESREERALSPRSMTSEEVSREHRRLAKEYDETLAQARTLPGFQDFLRPMKAQSLARAARHGPIVVINCHTDRCDALVILARDQTVHHMPLPHFSGNKAVEARQAIESALRCKGIRDRGVKVCQQPGHKDNMADVLAILWNDVVQPILDFLEYTDNDSADSLPHITWCPTGAMTFLPLHAAGDYSQPRSRVFNYAISSYTPTLTALLASTPSSSSSHRRVLAIGQANTPGHSSLPGTVKELASVKEHTQDSSEYLQLMDSQANVQAVLDAMEQHDWVHLACHAHQNVKDPTKSGFFLHDGTLDIATINKRSFKGKGLAFLSACQTAMGDEKLADEAVHLASGMLMAGYSSVVATMWSVHDADAPLVADKVYAHLMTDMKLENGGAGRALHSAVAHLRQKVGDEAFERWVPYIHIGS
ncbi:aromatic di-alanine and TPR containing protein [Rhizoctonia solani AG-3 Rhs1AP]|uniref:Aromatic di-alanine and TPR containing protein n=1 Tax=Rhizoctonia solani AG-3 Rhs1AP TaxID=1086054 RepID=X8J6J4_9AGAM|nr:aromatic di-alanine and TPR containing protein [Rhizoctonia solani AG-3 Rhs1AP]